MSKETIEKKLYPSQINTKTISARIPVQDYVKFLQESLQSNISLNDWLLIKIYKNQSIGMSDIENNNSEDRKEVIRIYKHDLVAKNNIDFYKEDFIGKDYIDMHKEYIADMMNDLMIWYKMANQKKASIQDIKTQLTILIKEKFQIIQDQKDYRKEIFDLLRELE